MADDKVVTLPQRGRPDQEMIDRLRRFVAEAEAGEIVSVAVVAVRPGGDVSDPSMTFYRWNRTWALIGGMAWFIRRMTEDD